MELIPRDTTPEAARVQAEVYRRMPPAKRLIIALRLSQSLRDITASGVRSRHPSYTEQEIKLATARLTIGDELFASAYPGVKIKV